MDICNLLVNTSLIQIPDPTYQYLNLTFSIIFTIFIVSGILSFHAARKRSGRLAKRSFSLLVVSGLGCIFSCFIVLFREFYGRQNIPCVAVLTLHPLIPALVTGPLIAKVYVHAFRLRKSLVRAGLSFQAVRKEQDRIDQGKTNIGHGLVHNLSSFVTLQQKSPESTVSDLFEVASPISGHAGTEENLVSSSDLEDEARSGHKFSLDGTNDLTQAKSKKSLVELDFIGTSQTTAASPSNLNRKTYNNNSNSQIDLLRKLSKTKHQGKSSITKPGSRISSYTAAGWWNPQAVETETDIALDELIKNESTWFGLFMTALLSAPFALAIGIRATIDPKYSNFCFGCDFESTDVFIMWGLTFFLIGVFTVAVIILRKSPDPLGIIWEAKLCCLVLVLFGTPTWLLYLYDPGNVEKNYFFTWFWFETITVILIFSIQSYGQILLTYWHNHHVPKNISLFRVLENVDLRDMFDEHLAGEVSIENLRFWDRAIHWKSAYADMPPDEIQRRAQDLFRIFLQEDAAMALNLSSSNLTQLHQAFSKPDPVSRNVFDDALKECFKLMNDGLSRFLRSEKYKAYTKYAPDFEGDVLRNKEVGIDINVSVDQYLKQFDQLHRPSFVERKEDTSASPRRHSFVSGYKNATPLAPSQEEDEEESARPISMRVRQSMTESKQTNRNGSMVGEVAVQRNSKTRNGSIVNAPIERSSFSGELSSSSNSPVRYPNLNLSAKKKSTVENEE